MLIHKTTLRVRYADTDQMHYAYNGKYFEYFEVGRTEMMREQGLTYRTIEKVDIKCRFMKHFYNLGILLFMMNF